MNKDVVYIEPEDDITDIIARVKGAKQKLVALVPPKKIGVLRSAVNTKLIAKAAKESKKVVVIVTTDPSLIRLAATAQIPVAKTLQSRPKLPSEIIEEVRESGEQVIDESDFDDEEFDPEPKNTTPVVSQHSKAQSANAKPVDQDITSDELEESDKSNKKSKKSKNNIPTLEKYRKWIILGSVAGVLLIVFLVWAFIFAPSVEIAVSMRTTANNFSENVSFVTNRGSENPEDGVFLLEQQKVEKTSSVEFTATGQKDIGEKASGTLNLVANITTKDGLTVPAGAIFTSNGNNYTTNKAIQFTVGKEDGADCLANILLGDGCEMSASVTATAASSGEKYNVPAGSTWSSSIGNVSATNPSAFTGGTSNTVTVVSQSDFDKAREKLSSEGREDGKAELIKLFGDDLTTIESSLEISTTDPKSTPAVDEEVKSGVTPKIEATTTYTMYAVSKTAVADFVRAKSEKTLAADQKIYAVDTPFFENFKKDNNTYTAKLKSSTQTGPKVTEEDVLEKAKGRKIGEVQSLLKSINGVSSVNIKKSVPWINKVPDDANKITIELKVEE